MSKSYFEQRIFGQNAPNAASEKTPDNAGESQPSQPQQPHRLYELQHHQPAPDSLPRNHGDKVHHEPALGVPQCHCRVEGVEK